MADYQTCKGCRFLDVYDHLKGKGYKCHKPRWRFRRTTASYKQLSTKACPRYEAEEPVHETEKALHDHNKG